jgi:SNF2 family DNA or RNA helicase
MFSLKRVGATIGDSGLRFNYVPETKEKALREVTDLFQRFKFNVVYSSEVKQVVGHFIAQQENFDEFARRAKSIRDDSFKHDKELMNEFAEFTEVIKNTVKRTLYPLQLLSAYHMTFAQNSCNFAVPGAGKTTIVYAAYSYLKHTDDESKHVDNIMVIGPTAAFDPWEDEYEECFGKRASSVRLSELNHDGRNNHLYSSKPAELTIISYGMLDRYAADISEFLKKNKTLLVIDEAHYVKSLDGVWSNAALSFADKATARVALTGTPAPNGYEDIFNLYRFIWPHKYESIIGMNYASLKNLTKDVRSGQKASQLSERISPFFIRIRKSDLNLPNVNEHDPIIVKMSEKQKHIYDFIESKYVREFKMATNGNLKDALSKAKLIRLRQAATNPSLLSKPLDDYYRELGYTDEIGVDDSEIMKSISDFSLGEVPSKFIELGKLVNSILGRTGEKVLIWSSFIKNSKDLKDYLENIGYKTELLIGEVEKPERSKIIKKFNNPKNDDFRVVIANPRAVGESISLHKGCHNAIYLDMDYNAASFVQSKDRIHRVGLPAGTITHYYYMISENTIDNVINSRVNEKVDAMNRLINADIPLFVNNGLDPNDSNNEDLVKALIDDYTRRNSQ